MYSTDICNIALSSIGQGRIDSIDEDSEAARQCKLYYELTRKNLLSSFRWGFAERSEKLALVDTSVPKWEFAYAVPKKCLVVRQLYNKNGSMIEMDESTKDDNYHEYQISLMNESQRIIMADIENAWMDYTADITNAELFDASFAEALAHKLASHIAMPLSGSQNMAQSQYQLYQIAIQQAMYTSAIQNHHKPAYPTKYFDARR